MRTRISFTIAVPSNRSEQEDVSKCSQVAMKKNIYSRVTGIASETESSAMLSPRRNVLDSTSLS